jgi:6,7-dimethyl-8-ribityllumazine synthase
MDNPVEGNLNGQGLRVGLVSSRFNDFIVTHLVGGAETALRQCGVSAADVAHVQVPGSFELPAAAMKMAKSQKYDAIVCLGCVIRGATSHYDLVCTEATKGIAQVGAQTGVPTIFAVVTTDTIEQAIERAGTKMGNKGYDGALAAVEMANLFSKMDEDGNDALEEGK